MQYTAEIKEVLAVELAKKLSLRGSVWEAAAVLEADGMDIQAEDESVAQGG